MSKEEKLELLDVIERKYPKVYEMLKHFENNQYLDINPYRNNNGKICFEIIKEHFHDSNDVLDGNSDIIYDLIAADTASCLPLKPTFEDFKKKINDEMFNMVVDNYIDWSTVPHDVYSEFLQTLFHNEFEDFKTEIVEFFNESNLNEENKRSFSKEVEACENAQDLAGVLDAWEYFIFIDNFDDIVNGLLGQKMSVSLIHVTNDEFNTDLSATDNLINDSVLSRLLDKDLLPSEREEIFLDIEDSILNNEFTDNGIFHFLKAQGLTLDMLRSDEAYNEWIKQDNNSVFVKEFIQELDNVTGGGAVMTYLTEMSISDFTAIRMIEKIARQQYWDRNDPQKGKYDYDLSLVLNDTIKLDKVDCGIMEPCQGGGSTLEVSKYKPVKIPLSETIVLLKDAGKDNQPYRWYEADEIYGLSWSCYEHGKVEFNIKSDELALKEKEAIESKIDSKVNDSNNQSLKLN